MATDIVAAVEKAQKKLAEDKKEDSINVKPVLNAKITTNTDTVLEKPEKKLAKEKIKDAIHVAKSVDESLYPHIQDLVKDCENTKSELSKSDIRDSDDRMKGNMQVNHTEVNVVEFIDSDGDSLPHQSPKGSRGDGSMHVNADMADTDNGITEPANLGVDNQIHTAQIGEPASAFENTALFSSELMKHLRLAEQALQANNLDETEKNIQIASDICRILKLIKRVGCTRSETPQVIKTVDESKSTADEAEALAYIIRAAVDTARAATETKVISKGHPVEKETQETLNNEKQRIHAFGKPSVVAEATATLGKEKVAAIDAKEASGAQHVAEEKEGTLKNKERRFNIFNKPAVADAALATPQKRKIAMKEAKVVHEGNTISKAQPEVKEIQDSLKSLKNLFHIKKPAATDEAKVAAQEANGQAAYKEKRISLNNKEPPGSAGTSEHKKTAAEQCIATAEKAFSDKDFKRAQEYILKAKAYDPNADSKNMLADVEVILKYKKDSVITHIKMADDAIKNNNYSEAEMILTKALEIDPTDDLTYNKLNFVRTNISHKRDTAKFLLNLAERAKEKNNYVRALEHLRIARETDPSLQIDDMIKECQNTITHRITLATTFLHSADLAIQEKDFKKAQEFLLKIQELKVDIDLNEKLTQVRSLIASSSPNPLAGEPAATSTATAPSSQSEAEMSNQVSQYIVEALAANDAKWYYAAESWLKLANGIRVSDVGEELKKSVQKSLESLSNLSIKQQATLKKIQAESVLDRASQYLSVDNFEYAKILVIVSQNIYNLNKAPDMMRTIFGAKHEAETGTTEGKEKLVFKFNKSMSDDYIEAARLALRMDNLKLAVTYLEISYSYYSRPDIKSRIRELRAANTDGDQSVISKLLKTLEPLKWF